MTKHPFDKKTLGLLAPLVGMLMTGGALAQDKIPLTVWSDTARLPTFQTYQDTHPGIDLEVVTVAPSDLVAKIQLALRANGDLPDVIFMSDLGYGPMLSTRRTNFLMDISDAIPQDIQDDFLPAANGPCFVDGKLICMRNDVAHMILWYDKPLMDELGLSVPATWEDFEQLGADLAALDQGYFVGTGVEPFPVVSMLVAGGCETGFPVEGKSETIKIDLTSDGCIRAAQMVDNMLANGSLSKFGPFEPSFVSEAVAGKLVLTLGPTWFGEHVMKPVYEFAPGKVAVALPPKWSDQPEPLTWSWGGGTYGAWKDSAHPQEAVELLIWASTDIDNQEVAVTMPAHAPASAIWGAHINSDPYYASNDVFDVALAASEFSHPSYGGLRFDVTAAFAKIVGPEISGDGSLVDSLSAWQAELVNAAKVVGYTVEE